MPYNKSFIDQASSVKMTGYPGILTSRLVNNIYIQFVAKKRSKSFVNVLYKSLIEALVRYLLLSSCVQQGLKGI